MRLLGSSCSWQGSVSVKLIKYVDHACRGIFVCCVFRWMVLILCNVVMLCYRYKRGAL